MQTLKNNNAKLTTALQESLSHVEEWKKQLKHYEEESAKLKQRVQELEAAQSSASRTADTTAALIEEKRKLEQQVKELHGELDSKQQELLRQEEEMTSVKADNQHLRELMRSLEEEKSHLAEQLSDVQDRLQHLTGASDQRLQQLADKHKELGQMFQEALSIHQQMEAELK
jgi:homer protein